MPSTFKFVLPFRCKSLGRLQKTEVRIQLTDLVGCLDVSSGKIYPLLLVSDTTEIEVPPNTSPVHPRACGEHMKSSVWCPSVKNVPVVHGEPSFCSA